MQRRELIKMIAVITGSAVIGADIFLAGCKNKKDDFFNEDDIDFFDEVAETIIPKTNTPGAKDAATGKFMALYAAGCYDETNREILRDGISKLNEAAKQKYDAGFMKIDPAQSQALLTEIDSEAKKYNVQNTGGEKGKTLHYFTLMKQLTLLGFFTSEAGATQVLRYNPVPGKYEGCVDYKTGETAWA
ncbi:MAG: gluconate 2-dehydrogenase subunit 3 family protein [Ferruginibacter sp.]|nr:gluconate 2-dehydrogenase subunit 3 family protein [Chitinophagaceae bacterium]